MSRAASNTRRTDIDQQVEFVKRIQVDPIWFAENVLQLRQLPGEAPLSEAPDRSWELDQFQRDLLSAMADVIRKRRGLPTVLNHDGLTYFTVTAMHGPGKTFTAALAAHWFNSGFPGRIITTAPKFAQLKTRFFPEFRKIAARAVPWYQAALNIDSTKATWAGDDDWCLLAETASKPENLAGHHHRFLLIIVEEATGVPETLWPVIFGALSAGEVLMLLMISNPTKRTGTFARSHLHPDDAREYFRMAITLDKAQRVSRRWAEQMRRRYGEHSPIYKIRVLGQFATDDALQLVATAWVTDALMRESLADGSLPKLRISVDVADGGEDESVVTAGRHYQTGIDIVRQRAYSFGHDNATIECANAAEEMFTALKGRKHIDDFVVDSVGVGTGVAGVLLDRGYTVVRYKGGSASSNSKLWRNRRVQSYLVARDALREGRISFADDAFPPEDPHYAEELMAQLCSIRRVEANDRIEDIQTREQMRQAGIPSPDRADSLIMQFATQAPATSTRGGTGFHLEESALLEGL